MTMQLKVVTSAIGLLFVLGGLRPAHAAVAYSQNFEAPVTLQSASGGPATFVQITNDAGGSGWQIQGGSAGTGISGTGGVDSNGVGGSQGLFVTWDHTGAASGFYTFNQYTVYGLPGFVPGTTLADVTISMDLYVDGSESANNPLYVEFQGTGGTRSITPVLANGAYTHVSFPLSAMVGPAPDLTGSYSLRVGHGADGFGFDAGNTVRIDNVVVENRVPEPCTLLMIALGGSGLVAGRRCVKRA